MGHKAQPPALRRHAPVLAAVALTMGVGAGAVAWVAVAPTPSGTATAVAAPAAAAAPLARRMVVKNPPAPPATGHRGRPAPTIPVRTRTPAPEPTTVPAGPAQEVVTLVNAERTKAGCAPVRADAALGRAAQGHSADMAARSYFSHTSADGRTFADRIRAAGYTGGWLAENIAAGQTTATSVMTSWMSSSGHRANILNCRYTDLGVGYATGGPYDRYWTQDFGG